ncbi:hypothetical protein KCMC57_up01930 [Kitasatospora sp. CMC57]|uniref:FXSXX-COOH protein n=1 Tax=Kitasatospora sp. CMC57 TaxID=3231513 RepID=A0AB33JM76_9ACTN
MPVLLPTPQVIESPSGMTRSGVLAAAEAEVAPVTAVPSVAATSEIRGSTQDFFMQAFSSVSRGAD